MKMFFNAAVVAVSLMSISALADVVFPGGNSQQTDYYWQCVVVGFDAFGNIDQNAAAKITGRSDYVPTEAPQIVYLSNTQAMFCGQLYR